MTAETGASCVQGVQSGPTGVMPEDNNTYNQQLYSKAHGNDNNANGSSNKSVGISGPSSSSSPTFYDIEHAHMETWLDEHPEFVNNYFLR
ncbi:hypothetical protein PV327_007430 [Microctonus hyperodae]|uniref:Uncharacterized protein n=1 Tax=Microctonus hyperodae TaxID=165561 RepID=A0AA39FZL8_MICHY|nr:hypothetical protein PV327_007430 [Microctonus hyperodae]